MNPRNRIPIEWTMLLLAAPIGTATAQSFTGLGDLPGGLFYSFANGVSAGGAVVVGGSASAASNSDTFRWRSESGIQPLDWFGYARKVSDDGLVVVGANGIVSREAVRWTQAGGMQALGYLRSGDTLSDGFAVSADGSVITGRSGRIIPVATWEAFRWTDAGGMVGLGYLSPTHTISDGLGVCADGSVVVGESRVTSFGTPFEAFRWTPGGGMVGLGFLPGDNVSQAFAVSADGLTTVGVSTVLDGTGGEPFRWTQGDGMQSLGFLPGYSACFAYSVNADGSVVVGDCLTVTATSVPFLWTPSAGMRRLNTVLVNDYGLNLSGWQLSSAQCISADGRAIVGYGINPAGQGEAFLAILPGPCVGDLDGDGEIGLPDLAILLAHFGQPEVALPEVGDGDGDGDVDLQDLALLLANFGLTC